LAKLIEPTAVEIEVSALPTVAMTADGQIFGTVAYMSPEQARGEAVDARSDLFSLGVLLYEMATGQRPFGGTTHALIFDAILNRQPLPVRQLNPTIPPEFDRVIVRCLKKDPAARYPYVRALLTDLRSLKFSQESATKGSVATVPAIASIAVLPFSD